MEVCHRPWSLMNLKAVVQWPGFPGFSSRVSYNWSPAIPCTYAVFPHASWQLMILWTYEEMKSRVGPKNLQSKSYNNGHRCILKKLFSKTRLLLIFVYMNRCLQDVSKYLVWKGPSNVLLSVKIYYFHNHPKLGLALTVLAMYAGTDAHPLQIEPLLTSSV